MIPSHIPRIHQARSVDYLHSPGPTSEFLRFTGPSHSTPEVHGRGAERHREGGHQPGNRSPRPSRDPGGDHARCDVRSPWTGQRQGVHRLRGGCGS